jgi:hypothetical protein
MCLTQSISSLCIQLLNILRVISIHDYLILGRYNRDYSKRILIIHDSLLGIVRRVNCRREDKECIQNLKKWPVTRPRRWEGNVKANFRTVVRMKMDQNCVQWRSLVLPVLEP